MRVVLVVGGRMTAVLSAASTQRCLHAAACARVEAMGVLAAAGEIGTSDDTIRRRRASGGWTDTELAVLIASEAQARGRSGIVDALVEHVTGSRPTGQPVRLHGELVQEIGASGELVTRIAQAMRDGRVSAVEAKTLAALIRSRRESEDTLLADLDAAASDWRRP